MKKIFDRLTALVMVMLMFIQSCVPAITSFAKEEELDKRYVIQKLETLKQDTYANFSLNLATVIDDKNLDTDTNVKFVLNTTNVNSNIKLLVRKDFSLYDERTFDTVEEAHKEFDRVDKSLKDQGLSLDVSVVQEDGKYRIHNNYVPQADKEDFGDDYKVYSLKVVDEFDFDKEGLFNKLPENLKSTEQHRLQLAEERRLQQDGEVPEGDKHNRTYIFDFKVDKAVDSKLTTIALNKDDNNPLEVKQNADLFAAILDDKTYSTYQTEQLPAEVTSSIEHKKEVAEAKAQAEAKAKAEADAKAKAEAEEKAKADAKAKQEAEEKAKEEADAKAKQEAEKIKAEEAKKTEEQKALDEKAKAEKDAKAKQEADAKAKAEAEKLKAEAEAKQKAEAEEKAKQEELAKKQAEAEAKKAAEEKAKKDIENKKLLGLEKDTEENQEEEPIIKKKETTEEVKKEPATPEERKQKAEEFDKALQDKKEDIKKSEDKKDANNKEDNKSEENKGLLENIKKVFGLTNLQKADRELKAILSTEANGLKEVQALLSSFDAKYHLTKEEQAKLMEDNKDAIKALIEKDADKNFNPQMLFAPLRAPSQGLADKKYTIMTRFDVSTKAGPIKAGQSFIVQLDDRLTVKDPNTLKPIVNNGKTIATPFYDEKTNSIKYTIAETIPEDLQIPLAIDVDYNTGKIKELDKDATKHSIKNSISGIGVTGTVKLPETVVDDEGNVVNQIVEPGGENVYEIVEQSDDYKVYMDAFGTPVVENGKLTAIDWSITFSGTKDLNELGLISNATLVKGSGLKDFESILLNGKPVQTGDLSDNPIEGQLGIVKSKNHKLTFNTKEVKFNFRTPVEDAPQAKYVIDLSVVLKAKTKSGAVRLIFDKGFSEDVIKEETSKRVGMNNRTTILGEFAGESSATWTVTDEVSAGDKDIKFPLATRELTGEQSLTSAKMAVYGLDQDGKMVVKVKETDLNKQIPKERTNPADVQLPGRIAVYEYKTSLTESEQGYSLSGVNINKYQDIKVNQKWNKSADIQATIPDQKIEVKDQNGKHLKTYDIKGRNDQVFERDLTLDNVKYFNIKDDGTEERIHHKLVQDLPEDGQYSYTEGYNYQKSDDKVYYILNYIGEDQPTGSATLKVVKTDSKDPNQKLAGAKFTLYNSTYKVELVTDDNGEARFPNLEPGTYTLVENNAPAGYKNNKANTTVTVNNDGTVEVDGEGLSVENGTAKTQFAEHDQYPAWPDYMNAMHYGKVDDSGNIETYIYLKPRSNYKGGSTNRDTRLNLCIDNGKITNVEVFDVYPNQRDSIKQLMEDQDISYDTVGNNLGSSVLNQGVANDITGNPNVTDSFTNKKGYQVKFPKDRFNNDWGFLVKVTAKGSTESQVSYDWLTDPQEATKDNAKIQKSVSLSKISQNPASTDTIVNVRNEAFPKQPVKITKVDDDRQKKNPLANATFILMDNNGKTLQTVVTKEDGVADFGNLSPGNYVIEEQKAPQNYKASDVVFDVIVGEDGTVTYKARFKNGGGTPQPNVDYYIETENISEQIDKPTVTNVEQNLVVSEGKGSGSIGRKPGIWEAYMFESLIYTAKMHVSNVKPGSVLKIQFDPNLNFKQYVYEIPSPNYAKAYFDYNTNLLTYVFNNNLTGNEVDLSLKINGIIPDKYYATVSGDYSFNITVDPDGINSTQNYPVKADYDWYYDSSGTPPFSNYYTDIYEENGEKYFKGIIYYNALAKGSKGARTLNIDWISAKQTERIADMSVYPAQGKPAYTLDDMKIYKVDPYKNDKGQLTNEKNMPLSFGVRPEQYPDKYELVFDKENINPENYFSEKQGGFNVTYDPNKIKSSGTINQNGHSNHPIQIGTPAISAKNEGYVIVQTFKVKDFERYKSLWRLYYYSDGKNQAASYQKGNYNEAAAEQSGSEIPELYRQVVKLPNSPYTPGNFSIKKLDQTDNTKVLKGAVFTLTSNDGKVINRSTDENGVINFTELPPGFYTLVESKAPQGYAKSDSTWTVIVSSDGNVRITEKGITGSGESHYGKQILINVTNKPVREEFVVYKKDSKGKALPGAKFTITKQGDTAPLETKPSDANGIVKFSNNLTEGTYIIEEIEAPVGYNKTNKKWVLVIDKDGNKKVYNYVKPEESGSTEDKLDTLYYKDGTNWVDVKGRNTNGWPNYDNRWTGWAGNSKTAQYLGTRIVAINKDKNYVIQRYVINPEARNLGQTTASIHRQVPKDPNMEWYNGSAKYKVYKLDAPVAGYISDLRLQDYNAEDITNQITSGSEKGKFGEPDRLKLNLPATSSPIVIDVKVPYKEETGGVGTGMDWVVNNSNIYWKADYYERVTDIKEAGPTKTETGSIIGSYVGENSLDVTNDAKTYGFKIKKVKESNNDPIQGAVFRLTGPNDSPDERYMTTGSDGMLAFEDLPAGEYKLEEYIAAPGYEKATTTWTVKVTNEGKVYIKQNDDNTTLPQKVKNNLDVVHVNNNPSANRIRQYLAQNSTSLYGVDTGLEFGPEMVEAALRAGKVISYEILNTTSDQQKKYVKVDTDAQYLGNEEFLVKIDINSITQIDINVPVIIQLHDDVEFVRNSTISWKKNSDDRDQAPDNPSRWHSGYNPNTKTIEVKANEPSLKPGDTASIEFKVRLVKSLNTNGIANIFQSYKVYNSDVTKPRIKKIEAFAINKNAQNGTIITNPIDAQRNGQPVTFTAKPNPGYKLVGNVTVTNDKTGRDVPTRNGNTFTMPDSDVRINATFEAETFNITYNNPTGGTVSGQKTAKTDESVTLTVNPENGHKLKSLKVGEKDVTNDVANNQYTFTMLPRDVSVEAEFEQNTTKYTVSFSSNGGSGTMASQQVEANKNYELPANGFKPPEGKVFAGWNVSGSTKQPGEIITVKANVVIEPVWNDKAPETHNVIVQNPDQEGGTITAEPKSAIKDTQINLTVTPKEGYEIEGVTMNGQPLTAGADGKYSFTMPAGDATVSATFKKIDDTPDPTEGWKEITSEEAAQITNKQVGIEFKVIKQKDDRTFIQGAEFTLTKMTDDTYQTVDETFKKVTATSDENGNVVFKDADGKPLKLKTGNYQLVESKEPVGYKKQPSPWNLEVTEENGQLIIKSSGPEMVPADYIAKDASRAGDNLSSTDLIKYSAKITNIDTTLGTYVQRIYIDTRGYTGNEKINVQIIPTVKREEKDFVNADPPVTLEGGVKTAYRTTYKIENPDSALKPDDVLNKYSLSNSGVTMVNTARWRPFDWGFDEDILNLDKGVYFIDIEGYFDRKPKNREDAIKKLESIDIKVDFYEGAREFQEKQADGSWKSYPGAAYQKGNINNGITDMTDKEGQKYPDALGKNNGRIYPPVGDNEAKLLSVTTSANINPLYESPNMKVLQNETLRIKNEEVDYNITFSKNGKDKDDWDIGGTEVANRRLEGAIFMLQEYQGIFGWQDLSDKIVSSAFNGYFGFRGLKEGRYRLIEVQPPKGYKPIEGPIVDFNIITSSEDLEVKDDTGKTVKIIPKGQGYIKINDKQGSLYNTEGYTGNLIDYVTAATAKNLGKVINELPGKGKVSLTKVDENDQPLGKIHDMTTGLDKGARFKLTKLDKKDETNPDGSATTGNEVTKMVDENGKIVFDQLNIGHYRLEEIEPHPGHVNKDYVWEFTIGGKKLDPYAEDKSTPTRDITDKIILDKSTVTVQKTLSDDKTNIENAIYPHKAQNLNIKNEFKINKGTNIQPGDYFEVKLSDSIDLEGIYKNRTLTNLDIFADGVGTIAKAYYDKEQGVIRYVFTEFAKVFTLNDFTTSLSAWINLDKITTSRASEPVGIGLKDQDMKTRNIKIDYDIPSETSNPKYQGGGYYWQYDQWGRAHAVYYKHNVSGKIFELDPSTGEFTQYYYINRYNVTGYPDWNFRYDPYRWDTSNTKTIDYAKVKVWRLNDKTGNNIANSMPESFAINENDPNLTTVYDNYFNNPNYVNIHFNDGGRQSYIVQVKGKLPIEDIEELETAGEIWTSDTGVIAGRYDVARFNENQAEASAELSLKAVNPINKISFKKLDEKGEALKDAKFGLFKKNSSGNWPSSPYQTKTSGEDGTFDFSKLEPGDYKVEETDAPDGYVKLDKPVIEFTVQPSGKIVKKYIDNGKEVIEEINTATPIEVVNNKPIEFVKVDAEDNSKILPGAEFKVLYKKTLSDNKYEEYKVDGKTLTAKSDDKGKFSLKISKDGYYALEETKAPDGYSKFPGYIKEFKLENGKIQVLEKSSKRGSVQTDNDIISSQTIEINEKDKTFKQRIILNPNHKEWHFDGGDTQLRLYEDKWSVNTEGKKIRYAVLDENKSISDLKEENFKDFSPRSSTADPLMYAVARMYEESNYTKPSPTRSEIYTNKSLVVEFTGNIEESATSPMSIKMDVNSDLWKYSELTYSLDYDKIAKEDKIYVDYQSKDPIQVENRKGQYPHTGAMGIIGFLVVGGIMMATAYYKYRRKRRESALS